MAAGELVPRLWDIHLALYMLPFGLTKVLSFWYACWATAKAKGYAGWVGVVLLLIPMIGLVILIVLKDKHKTGSSKGAEMSPPKTTTQSSQFPVRMRTVAALLNIALVIAVAYLFLEHGVPNAREAWLVALMLLAPVVSLLVICFAPGQDRVLFSLRRSSLDKRENVDEMATRTYPFVLNNIFRFLRSLVSAPAQETAEEFIAKFAHETSLNYEEVDCMKHDLGIGDTTAVHAALLIHAYGIHLALQSTAARKLIQHADKANLEVQLLSEYVDASLKKIGVNENAARLYKEMRLEMQEMDSEFLGNSQNANAPFWAVTKRFLRIICDKELTDIAIMFRISESIANHMRSTTQIFEGLYESGYRF